MQCSVHDLREAVDACRRCGKPLCEVCGTDSGQTFVCIRCRTAAAGTDPVPAAGAWPDPAPGATAAASAATDPAAPAGAPATPAGSPVRAVASPHRSPPLAALLSFVPGLGQVYNRDYLKALVIVSLLVLLIGGSLHSPALGVFAAFVWFYQVVEAFHGALGGARAKPSTVSTAAAARSRPPLSAWILIAAGTVLFIENLTGALAGRIRVLLPAAVILVGLYLLLSYFRTAEDRA